MSLRPFVHVDQPLPDVGDTIELGGQERHHLGTVLRLSAGTPVELSDGQGRVATGVFHGDTIALAEPPWTVARPSPRLELAQALGKGRKVDEVVRLATELGVDTIHPIAAERSVARLTGERAEKARTRWTAVARAAAEQARRAFRPDIAPLCALDRLEVDGAELLIAAPAATALPDVVDDLRDAARVVLAIGPEGGWTNAELAAATAAGARLVGLGPTVLRTEHAGGAGLAVLAAGLGRWATGSRDAP